MKNAKELTLECTAFSFRDPKKVAEMFAEDGAFELPYLATFGLPRMVKVLRWSSFDAKKGQFNSNLDLH
jgi:hypothetical protein